MMPSVNFVKPKVYVVGVPRFDEAEFASFLRHKGMESFSFDPDVDDATRLVESGGRCCYMSFSKPRPGGTDAYIGNILKSAHGSVLEHANFTVIVTGVSRSLTHELVRHRAGFAYSQLSQRYVDSRDVAFIIPPAIEKDEEAIENFARHCHASLTHYEQMVEKLMAEHSTPEQLATMSVAEKTDLRKKVRQTARAVLPNATETVIQITANARAWRHFIEMRGSAHADVEIRRLALLIFRALMAIAPLLFVDYHITGNASTDDFEIVPVYRKV